MGFWGHRLFSQLSDPSMRVRPVRYARAAQISHVELSVNTLSCLGLLPKIASRN